MVSAGGDSKGCDRTVSVREEKKLVRLEAADKEQANGMDTQAMIPVLSMIAGLVALTCCGWVSVPDLKYTRYPSAAKLWELSDLAEGLAWLYQVPSKVTEAALQSAWYLKIGMWIGLLLGIVFILLAYRIKRKAAWIGRLAFLWNAGMALMAFVWVLDTNTALNLLEGRENSFGNLTIHSHVQLTAAAYLQILLALFMSLFIRKLLDTRREYAAEFYQTREESEDHGIRKRTVFSLVLILSAIPAVILFGIFFLNDRSFYFISLCVVILSMLPFFLVFENRRPQAREVVVIAVMAGLSVAGRVAFFMLPQFKPMAAIVIITGAALGAESGFLAGALAGFVSNFFFGQGPWTPWQMFALGLIGFFAGLIFRRKWGRWKHFQTYLCIYGGFAVFGIYGVVMDTASTSIWAKGFQVKTLLAMYVSGLPMNLIHGIATIVFLAVLGEPMMKKLERIRKKYGIMEA